MSTDKLIGVVVIRVFADQPAEIDTSTLPGIDEIEVVEHATSALRVFLEKPRFKVIQGGLE